jgi:hypothetical protein
VGAPASAPSGAAAAAAGVAGRIRPANAHRGGLEDCQRTAAIFAQHHCDTREAGQMYAAWRKGSPAIRKHILDDPALFF